MRRTLVLPGLVLAACVNIQTDPNERPDTLSPSDGPQTQFDPAARVIPLPHNLLLSEEGKVNLPARCGESEAAVALREKVLNALDGFGTFKPALQVTFSDAVDPDSLEGRFFLYDTGAAPGESEPVPLVAIPSSTERFSADCSESHPVHSVALIPRLPLNESSTYVAAVLSGVRSEAGEEFLPSTSWALVRQAENPVTVEDGVIVAEKTPFDPRHDEETLLGINRLWNAHAPILRYLTAASGVPREEVLLAWPLTTQSVSRAFDPTVDGTPAAALSGRPLVGVHSIAPAGAEATMIGALGEEACELLGCDRVGDILGGALLTPNFQIPTPNPLGTETTVPGPWSEPVTPKQIGNAPVRVLAFVPAGDVPVGGFPTVVFGHGLGGNKKNLFAIAAQLSSAGLAAVAIDWIGHGDRAVQVRDDAALGCDGEPSAEDFNKIHCFSPFLSTNLATTRDNIRQSALDAISLIESLQSCQDGACGDLVVDADRIGYFGHSLGGIIGASVVAMSPSVKTAVFNASGGGLVDLVERTGNPRIRCGVVDGLIRQGIVTGEVSDLTAQPPTGTCLGTDWVRQPGYQAFANAARWILDPADAINYAVRLRGRSILVQKVLDDAVVPNVVTAQFGALLGAPTMPTDAAVSPRPEPSASLLEAKTPALVLDYGTLPANEAGFPGNTYSHSSLLLPANDNVDGKLATARLQADALAFLIQNLLGQ